MGLYILNKKFIQDMELVDSQRQSIAASSRFKSVWDDFVIVFNNASSFVDFAVWHQRLGHMSWNRTRNISHVGLSHRDTKHFICDICSKAKQHRLPFFTSKTTSACAFELVHVDTWGAYHTKTHVGHRYFLTIVDDHTRATWTHLMVTKDEAISLLRSFVVMAKTQFDAKVKVIRSDNAQELNKSSEILEHFASTGITQQTSCVQTPQQNGVVERKHKHLIEMSRTILFQSSLPIRYWGECVLAATYLINQMLTKLLKGKTPYELFYGSSPSYDHLRVFGCLCFVTTNKQGRDKFQPRATACKFIRYPFGQKGTK